jgi:hypothetical protein
MAATWGIEYACNYEFAGDFRQAVRVRHGQHLVFDQDRNYPLPNLFVNVLHRLGIEEDKFATSTGDDAGLELRG